MLAWTVGAGGLLGSSVRAALEARDGIAEFDAQTKLPWGSDGDLADALATLGPRFLREATAQGGWAVVWCAGATVVASPAGAVDRDVQAFTLFLGALGAALAANPAAASLPGHLVLASSAGGVWGGHTGAPIAEATPVLALSDYGRGHLRREAALAAFVTGHPAVRAAVVRLSNLYGPGQRLDKPQGLVSHIARSLIHRRPVHIYVSLDTVRDYLLADDAGHGVVDVLGLLRRMPDPPPEPVVKILASETETSVGALLAVFRRVTRQRVAVTAGLSPLGRLQPASLRFRSGVWTEAGARGRTPLAEGVAQVYRRYLARFASGGLPPPRLADAGSERDNRA